MADVSMGAVDKKDPLVGVADPSGKLRREGSGSAGYDDSERQVATFIGDWDLLMRQCSGKLCCL